MKPRTRWLVGFGMILGTLGLALTAVNAGREAMRRRRCEDNLRMLALAMLQFESNHENFPPGASPLGIAPTDPPLPPERRWSWCVVAWIYGVGDGQLRFLIDGKKPWDDPVNLVPKIGSSRVDEEHDWIEPIGQLRTLTCPSHDHHADLSREPGTTDYVGIAGLGRDAPMLPAGHLRAGIFGYDRVTRLDDIKDGASNTLLFAETTEANGPWTAGGPATVRGADPARRPHIGPGRPFGGHPGGVNVAFADGSVRFLRYAIDPKVFEAMTTIAGGEDVRSPGD